MLAVPPPYRMRLLAVSDIPAVLAVDKLSFPTPATEQLYLNELTDNRLAHYQALIREEDHGETLVGYTGFWLIAGEIHISTIAVHPDERGRGRGEWLLLNLLLEARELDPLLVTLEVRRGNAVARTLYRKYRFEEVGVRRRYYRDTGEDAILMTVVPTVESGYWPWVAEQAGRIAEKPTAE